LESPGPWGINIIAEIKRASPSKGPIRPDLRIDSQAKAYENGGAAAISILTDRRYFQGNPKDFEQVRTVTDLPILRKDFVISSYQLYESVVMGADAVLLIVRALPEELLKECLGLCREIALDALVEIHTEPELEKATRAGARLIGINNRDLASFQTDLQNSVRLVGKLVPGQVAVAESGIGSRGDVEKLTAAGIWNFLIGESLVRAAEPERLLRQLLGCSDE
jgi:indole-3-glycerol phosphate synthase